MTQPRTARIAGLGTIALAAVFLGACGTNAPTSSGSVAPAASPSATSTSASPQPTASGEAPETSEASETGSSSGAAATATPGGSASKAPSATSGGVSGAGKAAGLPTDAGDYGDELVAAWEGGDKATIASHAAPKAAAALGAAKAGSGMLRVACEGDMCSYADEAGRRVTLTFDRAKVEAGAAHAVVSAKVSAA